MNILVLSTNTVQTIHLRLQKLELPSYYVNKNKQTGSRESLGSTESFNKDLKVAKTIFKLSQRNGWEYPKATYKELLVLFKPKNMPSCLGRQKQKLFITF